MWRNIVRTRKLEIDERVKGGQIRAMDATDFPFSTNLPSREGKRDDEIVVRSCLGTMGVWAAMCPTPWADSL